jgi:hypothetical protein
MEGYRIFQAQILAKDPVTPRQYSVVEIPNGQKLVGVQLGNALKDQSAPLLGSIVLVLQLDAFRSYILMVLREPYIFLTSNSQYAGFIPSTGDSTLDIHTGSNAILDGEIFMESTGPLSPTGQAIPGFGAQFKLGNNGVAQLTAGSMSEKLIVGGTAADDDHEVILTGKNGYFESQPTPVLNTQSSFNFTTNLLTGLNEGLSVATQYVIPTGLPNVVPPLPICELSMDPLGMLSLGNYVVGTDVPICSLTMFPTGVISLQSIGAGGIPGISIEGATGVTSINLGTLGAARITDTVTSAPVVDPVYWKFINAIQGFFTALSGFQGGSPVLHSELGALAAAFLVQSPIAPPSLTSKITTGSKTVLVGG